MIITNKPYLKPIDVDRINEMEQMPWTINNALSFDLNAITKPSGNTQVEIQIGHPSSSVNVVYTRQDIDHITKEKEDYEKKIRSLKERAELLREEVKKLVKQAHQELNSDIACQLSKKAEELEVLGSALSEKANLLEKVVDKLNDILDCLSRGKNFTMTYSIEKNGEYNPALDKIILYINNSQYYNSEQLLSTLIHELFHAFYHKHQPCSTIREIDEAMVEFSMLSYLRFIKDNTQNGYYQHLFNCAENSVNNKKYSMGELPAYGFGAYLFCHCDKPSKWVTTYYNRIGKIDGTDTIVQKYKNSLYPSYTNDERNTYNDLSCILFSKPNVNYVNSNTIVAGEEFVYDRIANVEMTCVTLPNGGCAITKVRIKSGRNRSVSIPPSIQKGRKKIPVTDIWSSSFPLTNDPITVEVPNSVTSISKGAFGDGYNVTFTDQDNFIYYDKDRTILKGYCGSKCNITIPNKVVSIGPSAFENNRYLIEAFIPESVVCIWENAFAGCSNLKNVTIPPTVIFIGTNAFNGVENITNNSSAIGFPWGARIVKEDFEYADKNMKILKKYLGNDSCVHIPNTVTTIAPNAFQNCNNLETVVIHPSVTHIVVNAFTGCNHLKNMAINSPATFIGEDIYTDLLKFDSPRYVDADFEFADEGRQILWRYLGHSENVCIPDTVTIIAPSAFKNCRELETINIPQSITQIWGNAFANCNRLRNVAIPNSIRYVGKNAFKNIANVKYNGDYDVCFPWGALQLVVDGDFAFEDMNKTHLLRYMGNSNTPIIPNSVTKIGRQAFKDITKLFIIIPDTITNIENDAFYRCDELHVYSPGQVKFQWSRENCYEYADAKMTILKKFHYRYKVPVTFPSNILKIEPDAFEGYTFDKPYNGKVEGFPWGGKFQIGDFEYADPEMTILKKYHGRIIPESFSDTIIKIEPTAFEGYVFDMPYNGKVEGFPWGGKFQIGDFEYADPEMTILKKYHGRIIPELFPDTIAKIESTAFEGYVFDKPYNSKVEGFPWGGKFQIGDFEYADAKMTILKKYHGRIIPESFSDTIIKIEPTAFEGLVFDYSYETNLSGFPWGANIIKDHFEYADIEMTILKAYHGVTDDVIIPDTVKIIRGFSFNDMSVKTIHIPSSITTIEEKAFVHCLNLTRIELPLSNFWISQIAFYHCYERNVKVIIGNDVFDVNNMQYFITHKALNWEFF